MRPLEFCALASGSKGNAVFVGSGGGGVLVDAGLSRRGVERSLRVAGLDPESVNAVVVTHEHRDHLWGVGMWARAQRVPVYITEACRRAIPQGFFGRGLEGVAIREFEPDRVFEAAGLEFTPVSTSHDAADSVGFRISDGKSVLGFATDLGVVSSTLLEAFRGAHLLYLESNHDDDLLAKGPYPWFLKQRIRSSRGHLSNAACAAMVAELLHPALRAVVLGHLSEINNQPRIAYESSRSALTQARAEEDVLLLVARQDRPGRIVRL